MEYLVQSYIQEVLSPNLFGMELIYNMKLVDLLNLDNAIHLNY